MPIASSIRNPHAARAIAATVADRPVADDFDRRLADILGFVAGLILAGLLVGGLRTIVADSAIASDPPVLSGTK